jgi:ABC-type multidrug transport system permease subunit
MESKALKIGWILMLILGIYRLVASFILPVMGEDISASILLGTTGAAIVGMSLGAYRKAEKWSWWTLLVVGVAPVLSCTIIHGIVPWALAGWILIILALAFPAKQILGKKTT